MLITVFVVMFLILIGTLFSFFAPSKYSEKEEYFER